MTLTNSEKQWIARVMHTISYIAFVESCNNVVRAERRSEGPHARGIVHSTRNSKSGPPIVPVDSAAAREQLIPPAIRGPASVPDVEEHAVKRGASRHAVVIDDIRVGYVTHRQWALASKLPVRVKLYIVGASAGDPVLEPAVMSVAGES